MNVLSKLQMRGFRWLSLFLVGAAVCTPVSEADACGNITLLRVEERVRLLSDAEDRLRRGLPALTVAWASRALGYLAWDHTSQPEMDARARRLIAIGTVRLGGKLQPSWLPAIQRKKLREAALLLAEQAAANPDDATLQTYLGEAYESVPNLRGEAFAVLSSLEASDRMVSPEGYGALARLRLAKASERTSWAMRPSQAVHEAMAAMAQARCETMAANPRRCRLKPT